MNAKSTRNFFIAALGLYILWLGSLVGLAVMSADRPATNRLRPVAAPAPVSAAPDRPNE